jgi:glucoamylase
MITFANHLLSQNNGTFVTQTLWPIIKNDLDYVMNNWNQSTFDLWEEVDSSSFFTTAVQHRSLREGAALATAIGQTTVVSGYNTQAANVLCFLQVCRSTIPPSIPLTLTWDSRIGTPPSLT